jgi:hypothetical protein
LWNCFKTATRSSPRTYLAPTAGYHHSVLIRLASTCNIPACYKSASNHPFRPLDLLTAMIKKRT